MKHYSVEVIHEVSGAYMNFEVDSDEDEMEVYAEILADISIVVDLVSDDDDDV